MDIGISDSMFSDIVLNSIYANRKESGSRVGRIRETQDYSAANNIHPEVEITDTDGDDRYRYP